MNDWTCNSGIAHPWLVCRSLCSWHSHSRFNTNGPTRLFISFWSRVESSKGNAWNGKMETWCCRHSMLANRTGLEGENVATNWKSCAFHGSWPGICEYRNTRVRQETGQQIVAAPWFVGHRIIQRPSNRMRACGKTSCKRRRVGVS